jgi:uncharacterized protein with ATP-grasp and redox domains
MRTYLDCIPCFFRQALEAARISGADMILSKGQGNFEALSEEKRPIFFMLMAKCPVVAKDIGCNVGDIVLLFNLKRG